MILAFFSSMRFNDRFFSFFLSFSFFSLSPFSFDLERSSPISYIPFREINRFVIVEEIKESVEMLLLKSNGLDHHLLSFHSTIPFRILPLLLICTHLSILEEIYNLDKSLANPSSHELKILNFYEHTYEQAHEKLNPS